MNLTAATVMVYFVGLVTFYTPPAPPPGAPPNPVGREVIVPMTPSGKTHGAVTLMPHEASLSIEGLHQGKTDCDTLKGTWDGKICNVNGLAGKTISLPASTTAFATGTRYARVPRMRGQCPNVTLDPACTAVIPHPFDTETGGGCTPSEYP